MENVNAKKGRSSKAKSKSDGYLDDRPWTSFEDQQLSYFVQENGPKNWVKLKKTLIGRTAKQCRERYLHVLAHLGTSNWTKAEDRNICESQKKFGNDWEKIASIMPERSPEAIKSRWIASLSKRAANFSLSQRAHRLSQKGNDQIVPPCSQSVIDQYFDMKAEIKAPIPVKIPMETRDTQPKEGSLEHRIEPFAVKEEKCLKNVEKPPKPKVFFNSEDSDYEISTFYSSNSKASKTEASYSFLCEKRETKILNFPRFQSTPIPPH